jgi:hypothetical protein
MSPAWAMGAGHLARSNTSNSGTVGCQQAVAQTKIPLNGVVGAEFGLPRVNNLTLWDAANQIFPHGDTYVFEQRSPNCLKLWKIVCAQHYGMIPAGKSSCNVSPKMPKGVMLQWI